MKPVLVAALVALVAAAGSTFAPAGEAETPAPPPTAAGPASTAPPATTAAPGSVSFSRDLVPVLKSSCASCHLTGSESGNLALHPGAAYKSIVGVPSIESKWLRVKPGAPDESYLLMKIEGTHLDAGGSGGRMPFNMQPLDAPTLQRFRDWIAAGAPEN